MLRRAYELGAQAARVKLGLAQPSLPSVGIKAPVKAPGLPGPGKAPSVGANLQPSVPSIPNPTPAPMSLGMQAAKLADAVGMGMMTPGSDGAAGSVPGDPTDEGRRQRSVVDRAFQMNEDFYATSAMPEPGSVSP
jgi:hypothetical protein